MEGYLELKSHKFLHSNRKYWFVLGPLSLSYYVHEADVTNGTPVDTIPLKDILHVDNYYNHKYSIKIITNNKSYVLKARSGNDIHNWMGNIKEKWHASNEGLLIEHGPTTTKKKSKKKKVTRSQTHTESDMLRNVQTLQIAKKLDFPMSKRLSRSVNNLQFDQPDIGLGRERVDSTASISSVKRYRRLDSSTSVTSNRLGVEGGSRNRLGTAESSSRRGSFSSLRSGSVVSGSSVGSNGRSKRTPRIPINTPLAHKFALQNESTLNEKVDIIISEDLEEFARISDVEDDYREDEVDSPIDKKQMFTDNPEDTSSPVELRQSFNRSMSEENEMLRQSVHVKFKSQEDIRRISIAQIKRKKTGRHKKKKNKDPENEEEEDTVDSGADNKNKHSGLSFSWLTNSLRRKRLKKKEQANEDVANKEQISKTIEIQHAPNLEQEKHEEKKENKSENTTNAAVELKRIDELAIAIINNNNNDTISVQKDQEKLELNEKELEAKAKLTELVHKSKSVQSNSIHTEVARQNSQEQVPIIQTERASTLPRTPSRKSSDSSMSFSSVVMDTLSVNKSKRNSSRHSSNSSGLGSLHSDVVIGEEIKEKVHKWRQKSKHRTDTILEISGPMGKIDSGAEKKEDTVEEKQRLLAEIDAQCVPKITDENKEEFLYCPLPQEIDDSETVVEAPVKPLEPEKAPKIPEKSTKFQIKQLELILNGKLNPKVIDEFQVMLKLESLKVVADLDIAAQTDEQDQDDKSGEQKSKSEKPMYDTPRHLEAPISLINTKYKNRISLQSDPDTSIYYNQQELSYYRNNSINMSRESSDSNFSAESVVVLRKKS